MNRLRLVLGELGAMLVPALIALAFAWVLPGPSGARLESLRIALIVGSVTGGVTLVASLIIVFVLLRLQRLNVGQVLLWAAVAGGAIPLILTTAMQILSRHISFSGEWLVAPFVGAIVAVAAAAAFCRISRVPWSGAWPGSPNAPWRVRSVIDGSVLFAGLALFAFAALVVHFHGTVPLPGQPWRSGPSPGILTPQGGVSARFRIGQSRAQALAVACASQQGQLLALDLDCTRGRVEAAGVAESRRLLTGEDESWSFRVNQPDWPPCIGLDAARLSVVFAHGQITAIEATCAGPPRVDWADE